MVSTRSQKIQRVASSGAETAEQPTSGNSAGEPGLRERLLSLPVELFGEVCSFLDALELRCLSLTDKTFWSVLASEKSDPIWRRAFKRTVPPLPECPKSMYGSHYAQVVLVQSCMICQAKTSDVRMQYFHRVRYCNACRQSNIISEKAVLELYPDYPLEFLKYLSSDAVSSNRVNLAPFYWHSREDQYLYLKATVAAVYELWKSLSKSADNPEQANTRLRARLEEYADDRIRSGLRMRDWQIGASSLKVVQRGNLQEARRAMIFAKLSGLGYQEVDFPRWHDEVNKAEALTDEEWERVRRRIVNATERNKNRRVLGGILARKYQRSRELNSLWDYAVAVASGTRAVRRESTERRACPAFSEFLDLAPVAALLETDTDGVPQQELSSIRPDALQFAIRGRRQYLVKLHNIRNGLPLDQVNEEEWSSLSNEETIAKLDAMAAELVRAVNGFWDSKRKTMDWYPSSHLSGSYVDLGVLIPVETLAPGLTLKVLEAIGKDPNTEEGVPTSENWLQKPEQYRCARCDERVAPHLTFAGTISHFLENKVWFDEASDAREKALIASSGSNDPLSWPTLDNDHDWNAEGDLIVSDNSHDKARIAKLHNQLKGAYGKDPEDYEGEDFTTRSRSSTNKGPGRRIRRICRLCPEGFAPQPMYLAALKVHIEHIHCKVTNVEKDTVVFNPRQDSVPANPWIFDVQFLSL